MQRQDDDTVHAAAIVLAAAARSTSTGLQRHQQQQLLDDHDRANCAAAKKTRWWSRLKAKLKWFRPHGHPQRIADASRSPEPGEQAAAGSSSSYSYAHHAPQPALAFVAPPSSPASSALTSESPSPVVLLNAHAGSSYSSPTASIFAIGPYAREPQQLVSPPAFSASAGLTEPSTAPLTPPPESGLYLLATTPSSPEVPFARFLWSSVAADQQRHCSGGGTGTPSEGFLHAYQLQPGSPALVSPGSTSSSPPPWNWNMQQQQQHWVGTLSDGGRVPINDKDESNDDEVAKGGGEFVFGSNADAVAGEQFAGDEVGGGGDATEQWPFLLAHSHS